MRIHFLKASRVQRALVVGAALVALLRARAIAEESAAPYIVRDTRNAAVALETAATDLLGTEPRRGLMGVQHILDDVRDDLVVESDDAYQTRWVSAPDAARRLLARAKPSVLADYDAVVGPTARSLLARAVKERDPKKLFDVVSRYLSSAAGIEAAKLLAEADFERGQALDAASTVRRALRVAPKDASLWRRLIDALDTAGDARGLASMEIPAEVLEASERGASEEGPEPSLGRRLAAARTRTAPLAQRQHENEATAARDQPASVDHVVRPLRWTAGAPMPNRVNDEGLGYFSPDDESATPARFLDRRKRLTPYFPVLFGRTVIVADGFTVAALDLLSGRKAWSFPEGDRPIPGLALASRTRGYVKGRTNLDLSHRPYVADGSVYAVLETNVHYVPRDLNGIEITTYRPRRVLVALDAANGEMRWRMGASDADARALEGLSVASDPVVSGGIAAVVMAGWEKRWRVYFAAFDARSGALRWKREIVGGQQELNLFGEVIRDLYAGAPAVADDVLYGPTGLGVFAAADLRTGEIRWVSSYAAYDLQRVEVWYATPMRLPTWGPSPVVVHGDCVLAAPNESPYLLCFDRLDGKLRWREPSEAKKGSSFVDQFLGVANDGKRDVVILSGRSVRALLLPTGVSVWRESLPDGVSSRGRGACSKSTVYVPTTRGLSRWSLAAEGRFLGLEAWPTGAQPGNVCLFPEVLVVAGGRVDEGSDETTDPAGPIEAFYDWTEIEARLAARRIESPTDPAVTLDEADLWRIMGKDVRAEPLYEEGRKLAQAARSTQLVERARRGTYLLRRDRGDAFGAAHRVPDARSAYERALQAAATPAERVEIRVRLDRVFESAALDVARVRNLEALASESDGVRAVLDAAEGEVPVRAAARLRLAAIHRAAGRAAEAVDALVAVLQEDADETLGGESARVRAAREISVLVGEAGPEPYARHEREARRRLEVAITGHDSALFERLLAEYPNASVVPGALLGLADRLLTGGSAAEAAGVFRRFLAAYPDRPEAPSVFARLARALAAAKSVAPARATLLTLERRYPDAKFAIDGRETTGADFARLERERLGPLATPIPERQLSPPVSERLHEPVETDRTIARVIPTNRPPGSTGIAPVLLDVGSDIVAVDATAGKIRFRKSWDSVGLSALVGDALVLSRPDSLVGLDPRTGQEIWTRPFSGRATFLDGGLGQVIVVIRRPGDRLRTTVMALDPVTADELWTRDVRDEPVEGLVTGEDAFVLVRRRTATNGAGGSRTFLVLAIHALLTGEPVREILVPADGWTDAGWRLIDPRTLITSSRDPRGVRIDAVDLAGGQPRWSKTLEGTARVRHLLPRNDAVVVIGIEGRVRALSLATGDALFDTAINGGVDTLYGTEPIVEGDSLYALLRAGPSTLLAEFDLKTGLARWTTPTSAPVNTGWFRKSGHVLVTIQVQQRRGQGPAPSHLISLVDARTGEVVHRIDGEGLSGWQPSAAISDGALVVIGEHAFAVYR